MAHILVFVTRRYNALELWPLLTALTEAEHTFECVSTQLSVRDEKSSDMFALDRTIKDVDLQEVGSTFQGISVISGHPADTKKYVTYRPLLRIVNAFAAKGLMTSAICSSVTSLWECVKGRRVSCYPMIANKERMRIGGAILTNVGVTVDGHIITGENFMMAGMWAEEICSFLAGGPPIYTLQDSGYIPLGTPRLLKGETKRLYNALKKGKSAT